MISNLLYVDASFVCGSRETSFNPQDEPNFHSMFTKNMAIVEQVGPIGLFNTAPQTVAHKFAVTDSLCDLMVNHVAVQIQTAAIVRKTTCRLY